jgi:hypothetical protein
MDQSAPTDPNCEGSFLEMTTAPGHGRRSQPIQPNQPALTISAVCDTQPIIEASCRIDAAASLLSYAVIGLIPLELAAETAIRLLEKAQRHLGAVA